MLEKYGIRKSASMLKENYYLSSLTEADPEADGMTPDPPQMEKPEMSNMDLGGQPVPPDYQGDRQDPNMPVDGDGDGMVYDETGGVPPGGMYGEEEPKTPKELGRIYELNKLYNKLYVINSILNNTPDEEITELRKMVRESFNIFRLILNNLDSYKEKIDEIILKFYEFVGQVVKQIDAHFKANSEKQ